MHLAGHGGGWEGVDSHKKSSRARAGRYAMAHLGFLSDPPGENRGGGKKTRGGDEENV